MTIDQLIIFYCMLTYMFQLTYGYKVIKYDDITVGIILYLFSPILFPIRIGALMDHSLRKVEKSLYEKQKQNEKNK